MPSVLKDSIKPKPKNTVWVLLYKFLGYPKYFGKYDTFSLLVMATDIFYLFEIYIPVAMNKNAKIY